VSPRVLSESRVETPAGAARRPDIAGALLGTGGLLALVLGVVRAQPLGFSSPEVMALLAASVLLLGAFVLVERRAAAPLLPLGLFRSRTLTVSVVMLAVNSAGFLAMFFLTAVYLQQALGLSALHAGVDFLPMGVAAIIAALGVSQIVTRVGTRPVQIAGTALAAAGLLLLAHSQANGSYAAQLLPGLVLFGAGILAIGIPTQVAATADVRREHAGVASGVIGSAWQIGGALGLAVVTTLSTAHVSAAVHAGAAPGQALLSGYHYGLTIAAALAVINGLLVFAAPRLRPTAAMVAAATA
jgi:predicted MFS family arabinose efflux permease